MLGGLPSCSRQLATAACCSTDWIQVLQPYQRPLYTRSAGTIVFALGQSDFVIASHGWRRAKRSLLAFLALALDGKLGGSEIRVQDSSAPVTAPISFFVLSRTRALSAALTRGVVRRCTPGLATRRTCKSALAPCSHVALACRRHYAASLQAPAGDQTLKWLVFAVSETDAAFFRVSFSSALHLYLDGPISLSPRRPPSSRHHKRLPPA